MAILLFALVGCVGTAAAQDIPAPGESAPQEVEARPNVVLIVADDLSQDVVKRHPGALPNITALAQNGVTFQNSFVTDPVCCPSRATSLTGQYKHNHGVDMNNQEPAFQRIDDNALPVWLDSEAVGYRTGYFGKYLNGYRGDHTPPGWDTWEGKQIVNHAPGDHRIPGYDADGLDSSGRTHTQVFAQHTAAFVKANGGPFFAFVAPFAPHHPEAHPPEYAGLYGGVRAPRTPSFNEANVSDKPRYVAARPRMSAAQIEKLDGTYRDMLRSTKDVDDMVGTIVGALRESGKLENTYVVFTSDNGFRFGQHRLGAGKWMPYEEDIRVPLVVSGPGVPKGATRSGFALNNDLAPTIADWAGAEAPPSVDGRSLDPLISGTAQGWRNAFEVEAIRNLNQSVLVRPAFEAVRTEGHLYVEYRSGARELYALSTDPYQLSNVAGKRPGTQNLLARRLDALINCAGESCKAAEGP